MILLETIIEFTVGALISVIFFRVDPLQAIQVLFGLYLGAFVMWLQLPEDAPESPHTRSTIHQTEHAK